MKHPFWCASIFFVMLCCITSSHAKQSLESIRQEVYDRVNDAMLNSGIDQEFEIEVGYLDKRLQLADCDAPLDYQFSQAQLRQDRVSVVVNCPTKTWRIRVPVVLKHFMDVVVANNTLQRGDLIQQGDLTLMRVNASRLNHYFTNLDDVSGQQASRLIRQGDIIKSNMVRPPKVVERGDQVKMTLLLPGLKVESMGLAMSDGVKGDTIHVKNLKSNRVIEATVIGPRLVSVSP